MLAALPEHALPLLMALQADGILFCRGLPGLGTKPEIVGWVCLILHVLAAGAVTGSQLCFWRAVRPLSPRTRAWRASSIFLN